MIATALARAPSLPISLRALQLGTLRLNDTEPEVCARRYQVREWQPSDGGFAGWKLIGGAWSWFFYPPWQAREFITIIRLADGAIAVAPRRWWKCDPRRLPRDEDSWAHPAWRAIEKHYETQRRWFQ
jgi:hypothetical protein